VKLATFDNSQIAVKLINKTKIEESCSQESLRLEAEVHLKLSHPHIIEMIAVAEDDDNLIFLLEYASNGTLQSIKITNLRLSTDEEKSPF